MRISSLILVSAISVAFFISACAEKSSDSGQDQSDVQEMQEGEKSRGMEVNEESSVVISREDAKAYVDAFQALGVEPIEQDFVNSFELNHGDLKAVLNDPDHQNEHKIYALIGLEEVTSNSSSFKMIFAIYNQELKEYAFYDFMRPCPVYCPSFLEDEPVGFTVGDLGDAEGFWFGRADLDSFLENALADGVESYLVVNKDAQDQTLELKTFLCGGNQQSCDTSDPEYGWVFAACGPDPMTNCYSFD